LLPAAEHLMELSNGHPDLLEVGRNTADRFLKALGPEALHAASVAKIKQGGKGLARAVYFLSQEYQRTSEMEDYLFLAAGQGDEEALSMARIRFQEKSISTATEATYARGLSAKVPAVRRGAALTFSASTVVPGDDTLDLLCTLPELSEPRVRAAAGISVDRAGAGFFEQLALDAVEGDTKRSARALAILTLAAAAPAPGEREELQSNQTRYTTAARLLEPEGLLFPDPPPRIAWVTQKPAGHSADVVHSASERAVIRSWLTRFVSIGTIVSGAFLALFVMAIALFLPGKTIHRPGQGAIGGAI